MKAKTKGILVGSVSIILISAVVSGLALLTRGFKSWNPKDWKTNANDVVNNIGTAFNDPKKIEVNITGTGKQQTANAKLTPSEVLDVFNTSLTSSSEKVFKGVEKAEYSYNCEDGLQLGAGKDSLSGNIVINLKDGYSFKSIDISMYNYNWNGTEYEDTKVSFDGSSTIQALSKVKDEELERVKTQKLTFKFDQPATKINVKVDGKALLQKLVFTVDYTDIVEETTK